MPIQDLGPRLVFEQPECPAHQDLAVFRSDMEDPRYPGRGDVLGIDQEREAPAGHDGSMPFGDSIRTRVAVFRVRIHDEGG